MLKKRVLTSALLIMMFNSVYQYSWNVFAKGLISTDGISLISSEGMFFIFVILSTFSQIFGGYISDLKGPRGVGILSAVLSALGYSAFLYGLILPLRYILWAAGSAGEGILYGIASNSALKWHKKERGLAVGIVSLGFGAGATFFNPIFLQINDIQTVGEIMTVVELIALPLLVMNLSYPEKSTGRRPLEAVLNVPFLLIYLAYAFGTVPLISLSSSLFILRSGVTFLIAVTLFPLMSGLGRPIMGNVSDKIGRKRTIAFALSVVILSSLLGLTDIPLVSEILIGFLGGALIPLFFALVGDTVGEAFMASVTGILYTGKTIGGFMGSMVVGYVAGYGIAYAWIFMALCAVISISLLYVESLVIRKRSITK